MSERCRVAVLGAGIGAAHVDGYALLPDRFDLRLICDLDEARARPLCAVSGAGYAADLKEAIADPDIDLVDICLPPHLHAPVAISALGAGKDVICEKPLAASLAEVDRIAAAAVETGRRVFPVFQYRFGHGAAALRALIDAGLAGTAYAASLETHWNRDAKYYAVPWRGTWAGERGGAILGHAIHIHDWLSFALGPVASVYAEADTRVNEIETEDCAALVLRMEDGALVTSSVTLGAADDTTRLRFCFEGFTAESARLPYAPAEGEWRFTARTPTDQARIDKVLARVPQVRTGFAGFLEAVADARDGRADRAVSLKDGRRSIAFVTAAYASVRSGQPVRLPIGADHPLYRGWAPRVGE